MLRKKLTTSVASAQTNQSAVAAVAGRRVRIISAVLSAGGTTTAVTFNTLAGATAISTLYTVLANSPLTLPVDDNGHGDTAVGEGLGITTGTGSTVTIDLTYQLM